MKVITAPRGTPAWHRARRGMITASQVLTIRPRAQGRTAYLEKIAGDLLDDPDHAENEPPRAWQILAEDNRRQSIREYRARHPDHYLEEPPLVVADTHAWLATSPDALVFSVGGTRLLAFASTRDYRQFAAAAAMLPEPGPARAARIQAQLAVTGIAEATLVLTYFDRVGGRHHWEIPFLADRQQQANFEIDAMMFRAEALAMASRWRQSDTSNNPRERA